MKQIRFCVILTALLCGLYAASADNHTTFWCNYEEGPNANFSLGSPWARGVAVLTEGRNGGQALSARRGLVDFTEAVAPIFTGTQYVTDDNFNLERGTIEMWIKSLSPIVNPDPESPKLRYLMHSAKYVGENHAFALVLTRFELEEGAGYRLLWTRGNGNAPERNWSVATTIDWQPGEWHHVAVTYSPESDALFVDGVQVATTPTGEGLDFIGANVAVGAPMYHSHLADCVIDEVRLSSEVLYTGDFTP